MPNKASGPKKARWTSAQKSEARKAPKKAHHRGQPDGPKSAPKRAARSDSAEGYTKRPRAERSPRWDREDPRRQGGPAARSRDDSAGPSDRRRLDRGRRPRSTTAAPPTRRYTSTAATPRTAMTGTTDRSAGSRTRARSDTCTVPMTSDPVSSAVSARCATAPRGSPTPPAATATRVGAPTRTGDRGGYQGRDDRGTSGGYQGQSVTTVAPRWLPGSQRPWHRGGYQGQA